MNTIIKTLLAALLLCPVIGLSQAAFKKFENSEKIGSVVINKGMIQIVADMSKHSDDEDAKAFSQLAKGIDQIKVFISEDAEAASEMTATAKQYVKKADLEELMKIRDKDSHVDFYVKSGKDDDHVREMIMLVSGMDKNEKGIDFETVLLTMTGDIDLTKIGTLVNTMNLPKDLEKAEK